MALFLAEDDVKGLLTIDMALEAVESAHAAHGRGRAVDTPRQRTRVPTAALHILQGALLDEGVFGYKAYTTAREANRFLVHLFEAANGRPLAVIEADWLGMMRTGAAGGVAAKWLAQEDAAEVGLIGTGWQAQGQIEALSRVRPLHRVKAYSRNGDKCRAFCERMSRHLDLEMLPVDGPEAAVSGADIVVTITTSATPVLEGAWLKAGAHVNAAGSNALIRRELDEKAVLRAGLVCVDSRATALREAGDLLPALEKGRLQEGQLMELGEIIAGVRPGRVGRDEVTLFESQGMAIQDIALAKCLYDLARERGKGVEMPY